VIKWSTRTVILGSWCCWQAAGIVSHAQVVRERDSTITGPRGRTIERKLQVERGPGFYDRSLQIQRPGGTLERNLSIQRGGLPGGGFGFRPWPIFQPGFFAPRPSSSFSFGIMAAPMIALPFGQAAVSPGVVGPGPMGMPPQGGVAPGAAPQPSPLDPVALAAQRLQSYHCNSRRDAAVELGRLGDPRAVPALVNVLKNDSSKDVKIAAATALGEIGVGESEVVLERCIIYEKRQDVRDAAATALRTLRERRSAASIVDSSAPPLRGRQSSAESQGPSQADVPRLSPSVPSTGSQTSPFRPKGQAQQLPLEGPGSGSAQPGDEDRVPPPPPRPVEPR